MNDLYYAPNEYGSPRPWGCGGREDFLDICYAQAAKQENNREERDLWIYMASMVLPRSTLERSQGRASHR